MTSRVRTALLVFTALGLIASTWALYVHYRLQSDPTYVSVCEVNESVSCQQVLTSQYGSVLGVPVAAGGAIWALLVFMLAAFGLKDAEVRDRVARRRLHLRARDTGPRERLLLRVRLVLRLEDRVPALHDDVRERHRDVPRFSEVGRTHRRIAVASRS